MSIREKSLELASNADFLDCLDFLLDSNAEFPLFNTRERQNYHLKQLKDAQDGSLMAIGEEAYQEYWRESVREVDADVVRYTSVYSPLGAFISTEEDFVRSPPECVLCLLECFAAYRQAKGKLELENIFFGKPSTRFKNHSDELRSKQIYRDFHTFHQLWSALNKQGKMKDRKRKGKWTLEETYHDFFINFFGLGRHPAHDEPKDMDTFLRGYQRYKDSLGAKNQWII